MAIWDEIGQGLNPIARLLAGSNTGKAGAKLGARISNNPQAMALFRGAGAGLSPGIAASRVGSSSRSRSDSPGGFGAIAGRFRSGVEDMIGQAAQNYSGMQQPQSNPLDQLLQMMQGMVGAGAGSTYEPDLDDLMSQIRRQIDPVYDARLAAIEELSGRATERIGAGRADVEGMYNQLSQDYGTMGEEAAGLLDESQQESQQISGQLKKNIKGNYSRIAEEQAELLQGLGQEHVMPDALAAQGADQAFQQSQADTMGAANESFYNQLGAADQGYYQQGAPLAKLEGANRSSDLLAQLEDYLAQAQAGQMELEGQRTSDINTAFNQMAMQAQQFAQQQSAGQGQQQWGRMTDLYNMLLPMYGPQEQPEQIGTQSQMIAGQLGLAPRENSQFQSALADIGSNPALLYGQIEDPRTGESVKTNPQQVSQIIREYARSKGLSSSVENALMMWAESVFS